jgi:O-antigen ligase
LLLGVPVWLLAVLLLAAGAVKWSFALFLGVLLSAAIATGWAAVEVARRKDALRAARATVIIVVAAAVPVVFDPHSGDVFNLPKYTLTVIGALVLIGLWVVASVHDRAVPRWRNGLQWVVGIVVAWTAISAFTSVDVRVSLLGNYGSYDGLYSAAAFGVIMMAAAEAFDAPDIRKVLGAFAFAGGGVVVFYGLIQLHDTEFHGTRWDFILWNLGSFSNDIFSTFGNPNHLGGYLAIILPIVVVLGFSTKRWWWRAAAGLLAAVILVEVLRTSARGAWVAVIAAFVVLAAMVAPEIKRRPVLAAGSAAAVVAIVVVGLAADGKRFLSHSLSTLFQSGGNTSVQQRYDIWTAAVHVAINHPVTGIGPDTFALVYPQYQSAAWVAALGPNYLVNGAHDIFMNVLADQGFIGLVLFLSLLFYVGLRSVGSWRRLRSLERGENVVEAVKEQARLHRVTLAMVTASIVAYIVQAVFNVQQVGLSFSFWLLIGCSTVIAQAVRVPDTLRPASLVAASPVEEGFWEPARPSLSSPRPVPAASSFRSGGGRRRPSGARRADTVPWWTLGVGAVVAVVVVFLALGADGPYRADHDYWAAYSSLKETSGSAAASSSKKPAQVGAVYFNDLKHSFALNPWEPTYPSAEANVLTNAVSHASSKSDAISYLTQAQTLSKDATKEKPLWAPYPSSEAEVDIDLSELQPADASADLAAAASLARQAIKDNPRDTAYHSLLSQIVARQHPKAAK